MSNARIPTLFFLTFTNGSDSPIFRRFFEELLLLAFFFFLSILKDCFGAKSSSSTKDGTLTSPRIGAFSMFPRPSRLASICLCRATRRAKNVSCTCEVIMLSLMQLSPHFSSRLASASRSRIYSFVASSTFQSYCSPDDDSRDRPLAMTTSS